MVFLNIIDRKTALASASTALCMHGMVRHGMGRYAAVGYGTHVLRRAAGFLVCLPRPSLKDNILGLFGTFAQHDELRLPTNNIKLFAFNQKFINMNLNTNN